VTGTLRAPDRGSALAPLAVQQEAALFLAYEAELLDGRHYEEWLAIVDDDYSYQVPVPRTPDNPFAPHYDDRTMLIDESKWSLTEQWFKRLAPDLYELSWAENPPVRFRHFLSNVRARATDQPDVYDVRSNVMLVGTRQSDAPKYVTGERFDTLRRGPEGLRLARRWVVLDQVVIDFPQLRMLL
jgi:3-phenylpropionate/cinnamic acid dioxygenase small subunit